MAGVFVAKRLCSVYVVSCSYGLESVLSVCTVIFFKMVAVFVISYNRKGICIVVLFVKLGAPIIVHTYIYQLPYLFILIV